MSEKKRAHSPPPRSVTQRIDDHVNSLDPLDASLLTTALNEPFPLVDTLAESLEAGNDADELALTIDATKLLHFPLSDSEFSVDANDFAPLLALMKQVLAEVKRLAGEFEGRLVEDGALGRFIDTPTAVDK